jgi:hypothetical protein
VGGLEGLPEELRVTGGVRRTRAHDRDERARQHGECRTHRDESDAPKQAAAV